MRPDLPPERPGGSGPPAASDRAPAAARPVSAAGNGAMRPDLPPERPGGSGRFARERGSPAWWFRRQLVLAGVAGGVVLVAVAGAGFAIDQGRDAAAAALRPSADGRGVTAVSPAAEWSRTATWVVGVAVVAVAAVLTLLLDHAFRVARFLVLARPGRPDPEDAAAEAAQEEHRAWP